MCVMACISRMTIHMMTMTTSSHRIPKIPTITIVSSAPQPDHRRYQGRGTTQGTERLPGP